MKFIADAMLGRLARWLRLLGFDTLYYPDIDDGRLLKVARQEGRTILTRDTRLGGREAARLMVKSDDVVEQLRQVLEDLRLSPAAQARCANCNGTLEDVESREDVRGLVPEHVYLSHAGFQRCAACGHVYWEGSQQRRLRKRLGDMIKSFHGGGG